MHGHRDPGVKEGTLPDRLSGVRNVETPLESGLFQSADRKGGPILQGDRTIQEANAGRRKAGGSHNPPDRAIPTPQGS
jgi:hypothetical protein